MSHIAHHRLFQPKYSIQIIVSVTCDYRESSQVHKLFDRA